MNEQGWIEWNGGECPLTEGQTAQISFRVDGRGIVSGWASYPSSLRWSNTDSKGDIIAYRIVEPGK